MNEVSSRGFPFVGEKHFLPPREGKEGVNGRETGEECNDEGVSPLNSPRGFRYG